MNKAIKLGFLVFALSLIFISVDTVSAQNHKQIRKARKEYRKDVREARRDYRKDVRKGDTYRSARREYREDRRDARHEYRSRTGRRINRGYSISRTRRAYPQRYRVYYSNGRRYVRYY